MRYRDCRFTFHYTENFIDQNPRGARHLHHFFTNEYLFQDVFFRQSPESFDIDFFLLQIDCSKSSCSCDLYFRKAKRMTRIAVAGCLKPIDIGNNTSQLLKSSNFELEQVVRSQISSSCKHHLLLVDGCSVACSWNDVNSLPVD